jgi:hypothetical protein
MSTAHSKVHGAELMIMQMKYAKECLPQGAENKTPQLQDAAGEFLL